MKCEECVEAGEKSRITPHGSSKTLMYCARYYDEEGVFHNHDYNTVRSSYSCSNGHRWSSSGKGACSADGCDFGGDFEITRQEPKPPRQDAVSVTGYSTVPAGGEIIKAYPAKDFYDENGKARVGWTDLPLAKDSTDG